MQIANPIYDVVFKYLMKNKEIAKDILSAILNENVISLELKTSEIPVEVPQKLKTVRYDFIATIKNADETEKTVQVEIQKRKKGDEIPRFRRYLGNIYIGDDEPDTKKISLPITTIYFLGYRLLNIKLPVFKIDRTYTNAATHKRIRKPKKEDFVEQLSHDMYVIQIPRLKMVAQTRVEKLLDVFSQKKYVTDNNQIHDYTGDMSDPKVARMIRQLSRAMVSQEVRHKMDEEDSADSFIDGLEAEAEEARKEKQAADERAEREYIARIAADARAGREREAKEEANMRADQERKAKEEAIAKAAEADAKAAEADAKAAEADAKAAEAVEALELARKEKVISDAKIAFLEKHYADSIKKGKNENDLN
jgi:chemotaxis protein histidine kinase CheA